MKKQHCEIVHYPVEPAISDFVSAITKALPMWKTPGNWQPSWSSNTCRATPYYFTSETFLADRGCTAICPHMGHLWHGL